ncbi:MAG TPA: glycoside hydrolase family 38 C-terminal domain-containing protein, partial [Devosia sp.]|nr:glycoside hydrolase family 38 C-terminal domain-containing protein [Devosia sp.]
AQTLGAALASAGHHAVLNSTSLTRSGLLHLPAGTKGIEIGGATIPAQKITRADGTSASVAPLANVPGLSTQSLRLATSASPLPATTLSVSPTLLENAFLRARFNEKGQLTSLFDKRANREALKSGEVGNALVAHRDIPIDFDAWDIDENFENQSWPVDNLVSAEVVEHGPYRAAIRFTWTYEASRIVQVVSLAENIAQLEFDTLVDWHEHQTLLKTGFPLDIRTDVSRAETQFGHLTRPTHANTSWDKARFETSMHRWVDLSETGFGVAALNDCKYGYDAKGSALRLTLVKSPVFPWPEADQGEHRFRYALLLHAGDLQAVHNAATAFNLPLRLLAGGAETAPSPAPIATLSSDQIAIETVKAGEDGQRTILRLWETQNRAGTVTLTLPRKSRISQTDLYENDISVLSESTDSLELAFKPFQILTLALS